MEPFLKSDLNVQMIRFGMRSETAGLICLGEITQSWSIRFVTNSPLGYICITPCLHLLAYNVTPWEQRLLSNYLLLPWVSHSADQNILYNSCKKSSAEKGLYSTYFPSFLLLPSPFFCFPSLSNYLPQCCCQVEHSQFLPFHLSIFLLLFLKYCSV